MAAGEGRTSNMRQRGRQRRLEEVDEMKQKADEVERGRSISQEEEEEEEELIPTLPCCYLAPSLWTGLFWAGLGALTGAGRPRTTCLWAGRDRGGEGGEEEEEKGVEGGQDRKEDKENI